MYGYESSTNLATDIAVRRPKTKRKAIFQQKKGKSII
jgi:hypothetical protein